MKIEDIDLQAAKAISTMIEDEQLLFNKLSSRELAIAKFCCEWLTGLHARMEKSHAAEKAPMVVTKKVEKPKKSKKGSDGTN